MFVDTNYLPIKVVRVVCPSHESNKITTKLVKVVLANDIKKAVAPAAHWIVRKYLICSNCGYKRYTNSPPKYCENCGVRMKDETV